jgi:RNA polymerase sigma factor (sigma-70 family)
MENRDQQIFEDIRAGKDDKALAEIYKRSLPRIRKYILSNSGKEEDVKDIFQDTMVIFYRQVKARKFREDADIDTFLFHVARNLYINYVKRYSNRNLKIQVNEPTDSSADLLQQLIGKEKERYIEKLFSQLGKNCSELLKLRIYNNLSMKEIAIKLEMLNEDVAKAKAYRCRQRLSELVKGNKEFLNFFKP